MDKQLKPLSVVEIRDQLQAAVSKDLLGPVGDDYEEVTEPTVRGRYLVGMLAPKNQSRPGQTSVLPEDEDTSGTETPLAHDGDDSEDGATEADLPASVSMLPSAMGLSFSAVGTATAIQIKAGWGNYQRGDSTDPANTKKDGSPRKVWQRIPVGGETIIPLEAGPFTWTPDFEFPEVKVRGLIRRAGDYWAVTCYLVNQQTEPEKLKDSAWLFQPQLVINAPDDTPIFIKRPVQPFDGGEGEDLAMQMSYRREVEFAVGHSVAVHAEANPDDWEHARRLSTTFIPSYDVAKVTPPTATDIPLLAQAVFDMKILAETPDDQFGAALEPLLQAYATWIDVQDALANRPPADLQPYQSAAAQTVAHARQTLQRIRDGIELLATDPQAADAFRFANRAMWQQRIHSIYVRRKRAGEKLTHVSEVDHPENRRWYPFQLAFVLLNLPAVTNPHHPDRRPDADAIADLLWFPTGGGKTEAYLGLTAYTLGIRRLQGVVAGYDGGSGVAVLMRYTLRLLTLQQFQRATALICACEEIRQTDSRRWGDEPFRIGLWVGAGSTPNSTQASAEAIKQSRGKFGGQGQGRGTPYQLTYCPWCGSDIGPGRDMRVEPTGSGRGRTLIHCGDPLGQCSFSHRKAPHEGLPVLVVDEEIYRRLPALLIATVDKFAQMPWKGETQMLFGKVTGYCERHGYRSPEIEDKDFHRATKTLPAAKTIPAGPLRPPDLIIQDELHLISGPLGTLVGLYETAIDHLATWQVDGQAVRPKVVASTATIRRAKTQVNQLYLRQVNIFPPPGLEHRDNFFARQRPPSAETPGRRYLGVCAPGTRLKTILIRVYVAYMAAAQQLFDQHSTVVDPYMTLVGYFNSMRELGGMRRVVDDAVRTRLQKAKMRGLANRFIEHYTVEELTSRKGATDIPQILAQLEKPFKTSKTKGKDFPLDVLLATNMISVGVDVNRLGLMVVAGQPKTTAEYIQATSRVGRHFPGLVCTVYNWTRPRDLSHYERFEHYHASFYQNVEPLSVTPFSARALDRGLTGVLAATIRLGDDRFNPNLGAGAVTRSDPAVQDALAAIVRRAGAVSGEVAVENEVRAAVEERLDLWLRQAQTTGGARLGYKAKRDGRTKELLKPAEGADGDKFACLNSLRNVEPSVGLILDDYGMEVDDAKR